MLLTFCNPMAVPDESTFVYFCGSQDNHKVPTARFSPNSLVASIPGKRELSPCILVVALSASYILE